MVTITCMLDNSYQHHIRKVALAKTKELHQARLAERILWPSFCSTLLNSGTNGRSTSSMRVFKAFHSFSSDFFMIVPLSLPGAKLPAVEKTPMNCVFTIHNVVNGLEQS